MPQLIDWEYDSKSKLIAVTVDDDGDGAEEFEPVRHGRWVRKTGNGYYWYECSECGAKPLKNSYKDDCFSDYCPHCGAKMDGGADNA